MEKWLLVNLTIDLRIGKPRFGGLTDSIYTSRSLVHSQYVIRLNSVVEEWQRDSWGRREIKKRYGLNLCTRKRRGCLAISMVFVARYQCGETTFAPPWICTHAWCLPSGYGTLTRELHAQRERQYTRSIGWYKDERGWSYFFDRVYRFNAWRNRAWETTTTTTTTTED